MPALDFCQALLSMFEHSRDMFRGYSRKPFEELIDCRAGFQVFEKGPDGDAGSAKNPRATDLVMRALDFSAIGPIQHVEHDMLRIRGSASSFGVKYKT